MKAAVGHARDDYQRSPQLELRAERNAILDHVERGSHVLDLTTGEVLELVTSGLTNAAIGERLRIAPGTVKKHLDHIYAKLGVASRTAAAGRARGAGL